MKGRQKSAGHQVIERALIRRELCRVHPVRGRDQRVVIGHLGGVEGPRGHGQLAVRQRAGRIGLIGLRQHPDGLRRFGDHVRREITAVRAGIGQRLVGLVERLSELQGFVRREAQQAVGVTLQAGQVIELWGLLRLPRGLCADDPGGLSLYPGRHGFRLRAILQAVVRLPLLREPHTLIVPEVCRQHREGLWLEGLDLLTAFNQKGQGRGLDASHGEQHAVAQGEGPAGVHAHKPVRLAAAPGRSVQPVVFLSRLDRPEALPDGLVGHRVDPQAVHRLFAPGHGIDVAEDQFSLPPRVGRADDLFRLRRVDQGFDHLVLVPGGGDHLQRDVLRQHGQGVEGPLLVCRIHLIRLLEGDQMAHRPGHGITLADQAALAPVPTAQDPGDVPPDAGLFRHHHDAARLQAVHPIALLSAKDYHSFRASAICFRYCHL